MFDDSGLQLIPSHKAHISLIVRQHCASPGSYNYFEHLRPFEEYESLFNMIGEWFYYMTSMNGRRSTQLRLGRCIMDIVEYLRSLSPSFTRQCNFLEMMIKVF